MVGTTPTIELMRNGRMTLTYGRNSVTTTLYNLNGGDWSTNNASAYYTDPSTITVEIL
jgi:hypothetical protein